MKNIFIILILIILLTILFNKSKENFSINDFKYYDENDNIIDHKNIEIDEQEMALKYIEPYDIVLELGARYGSVSVPVSKIVENKGKLVSVEPDDKVIKALEKNKSINNSKFEILNKCISNKNKSIKYAGYSTMMIDSNDNNDNVITYNEFKTLYPYKFNVLIADCEGCLEEFLETIGSDINNFNKILLEADQTHLCNYEKIINNLKEIGFKIIEDNFNVIHRYYLKK